MEGNLFEQEISQAYIRVYLTYTHLCNFNERNCITPYPRNSYTKRPLYINPTCFDKLQNELSNYITSYLLLEPLFQYLYR